MSETNVFTSVLTILQNRFWGTKFRPALSKVISLATGTSARRSNERVKDERRLRGRPYLNSGRDLACLHSPPVEYAQWRDSRNHGGPRSDCRPRRTLNAITIGEPRPRRLIQPFNAAMRVEVEGQVQKCTGWRCGSSENSSRITAINDDLNLGRHQSTPSARHFRTYPETTEGPFGHWTELWDVLEWVE